MAYEKEIIITANTKGAVTGLQDVSEKAKEASGNMDNVKGAIDNATGGVLSKFKGMATGLKGVTQGFGALKGAIIATGIGALLILVTSLIEYFKNFEGGVKLITNVMNLFSNTIAAIVANAKKLLSLDFKGFFGGVKDAMVESVNATNDLFSAQTKLYELNKKFIKENALLSAEIESQGRIIRDTTKTYEERLEAQKELDRLSEKLITNEKELNDAELVRLKTELRLENNYEKRRDLEIQIEQTMANLIGVESKLAAQREKADKAQRQILDERENKRKAAIEKANEIAKKAAEENKKRLEKEREEKQKKIDEEIKNEEDRLKAIANLNDQYAKKLEDLEDDTELKKIARQEERALLELEALNATEEQKSNLKIYYANLTADAQKKIDDKAKADKDVLDAKTLEDERTVADAKKSIQDAQLNNVRAGFALLGQLAGKNKALQAASIVAENAVGIAKQVIATRSANALVTAKYALLPGGVALAQAEKLINNISLGIGVASSVAATTKALSALGGGGSASGASTGNDGGSITSAPSFNLVQGTGSNQIAQGLGQQQRPIQAYVVSNNVTTAQSLDRNIIAGASL